MTGAREFRVALTLLCVITFTAAPQAQLAQPGSPAPLPPSSTVPRSVAFNGQVLTPAGDARTGSVLLTFGLYSDQKDTTPLWTEQQLVALDADGRYSVTLGSSSRDGLPADAFAAGAARWLGVQVEGDIEQPRFMLLSVPYALKAADADTIAGKPVTDFVTETILTDTVKETVKTAIKESASTPDNPQVTTNALVKYANSGGTLTESSTVDVGGKLGVQVAAPIGELDLAGFGSSTTITMRNGGSAADVMKLVGADGSLRIGSATTANLINLIGPWVGIGTTTPVAPLHVRGADAASTTFTLENVSGQASRPVYLSSYGSAGAGAYWSGLDSANTSSLFGPNLLVVRANNGLAFSGSSAAEHVRIAPDGNVGIGTTTPAQKLTVQASGYGLTQTDGTITVGSYVGLNGGWYGTRTNHPLYFFANDSFPIMTVTPSGNVGIGVTNPAGSKLSIKTNTALTTDLAIDVSDSNGSHNFWVTSQGHMVVGRVDAQTAVHVCQWFGYLSSCSSAAEYVPTVETTAASPEAGDLVSIAGANPYGDGHAPFAVGKSAKACDENLLGYLLDPELGAEGKKVNDRYLPLAIYGYFPAKVTIENGAVKRGDPITSSSKPGFGMKATGACRIVGYALEDADADGTIQVFAHLSESTASAAAPLQTEVAALRRDNADLQTRLDRLEQALSAILANPSGTVLAKAEGR